jgi:hypothetical protein
VTHATSIGRGAKAIAAARCAEAQAASEKEGNLRMMEPGRWAAYRPGQLPVDITSGELFRVELAGATELQLTRMEYNHADRVITQ